MAALIIILMFVIFLVQTLQIQITGQLKQFFEEKEKEVIVS